MASSKRQLLIDTALDLFRREGYHATGIDRVIAEAGVARMTLYNHFKSKDELILAALRHRDSGFRDGLVRRVEHLADTPG
ncbi:MAG TPA: TetR family transcriptional regulator, partial [Rhodospirillaceae bacterium]|nr:TetR family transcriptional regulator [Rhodospirillaceae bacterium]